MLVMLLGYEMKVAICGSLGVVISVLKQLVIILFQDCH